MNLLPMSATQIPFAFSLLSAGPAAEIGEDYRLLDVNDLITHGREGFAAFEVTGDSMVDHVHPGNLVFIDTWAEPQNGDIVASMVNGLTCIKIFKRSVTGLYLVSANTRYAPRRILPEDSFHVLGVVKGHLALY